MYNDSELASIRSKMYNDSELASMETRSLEEKIICSLVLIILILMGMIGNILVMTAVLNVISLRQQLCNYFILNLCITDLLTSSIVMISSLISIITDLSHIPHSLCNFICASNYVLIIVSMLTLSYISIDRYIAINYPLNYSKMITKNTVTFMIIYAWLQGIIFAAIPVLLQWVHYDYWEVVCAIDWHVQKQQAVYYVIAACVVCFLIPGLIIIFTYTTIMIKVGKLKNLANTVPSQDVDTITQRAIMSIIVMVIVFFICMTPFCITKLLKVVFTQTSKVPGYVNLFASFMQYSSSVVNPFIYAIFRIEFRKAFKYFIMSAYCQRPQTLHTMSEITLSGVK